MQATDKPQRNSPACTACQGATVWRLRLPDMDIRKQFDVFECRRCGRHDWVEVHPERAARISRVEGTSDPS
jgi:hypothetical protein